MTTPKIILLVAVIVVAYVSIGCAGLKLKSQWKEVVNAQEPACTVLELAQDGLGVDAIFSSDRRFGIVSRTRSGDRAVHLFGVEDFDSDFDSTEMTSLSIGSESEVIAIFGDSGAALAISRNEEGGEIRLFTKNASSTPIGKMPGRYFDILHAVAFGDSIAIVSLEYSDDGNKTHLTKLVRQQQTMAWTSTYELIGPIEVVKFADHRMLGWIGSAGIDARLVIHNLRDSTKIEQKFQWPARVREVTNRQLSGYETAQGWRIGIVGTDQSTASTVISLVEIGRSEQELGPARMVKTVGGIEDLSFSQAGTFQIAEKTLIAMGNWLDAERTLGTYQFATESLESELSSKYFGQFPENSQIEGIALSPTGTIGWTVKERASYGWIFKRCFIRVESERD